MSIFDTTNQIISSFDDFSIVPWSFEDDFIKPWNKMAEVCRFRKFVDAKSQVSITQATLDHHLCQPAIFRRQQEDRQKRSDLSIPREVAICLPVPREQPQGRR